MLNKKAQGLSNIALIILSVIIIVFAVIFIFQSGILSSTTNFFCPTVTQVGTGVRGPFIKILDNIYDKMTEVEDPELWEVIRVGNNLATGISQTAIRTIVKDMFDEVKENFPLMTCTTPNTDMGYSTPCKSGGVAKETFLKEVSKRIGDCYAMYGSGNYNPLENTNLQNPRTCFVIQFNIEEPVTFQDIIDYTRENTDVSDFGVEGKERDDWKEFTTHPADKQIKKGIMFITYADVGGSEWDNDDCGIYKDIYWDNQDHVVLCIEEEASYDENCNSFGWSI